MNLHESGNKRKPALPQVNAQHSEAGIDSEKLLSNLLPVIKNLDTEIISRFQKSTGLTYLPEKEPEGKVCYLNNPEVRADYKFTFTPVDVLDYIYAVFYSQNFRKNTPEIREYEFPQVPYPKNSETFWKLVELGNKLRHMYLTGLTSVDKRTKEIPLLQEIDKVMAE